MQSADIIPAGKRGLLVALLTELQTALAGPVQPVDAPRASKGGAPKALDAGEAKDGDGDDGLDPTARMGEVGDYLEQLYEEDVGVKVAAARKIATLAHKGDNLQALAENDVLVGALARVLKDDYKKSTELTLAIMLFFSCLAHFKEMHVFVVGARMGDLSLRIVDLEERRHVARVSDLERFTVLTGFQASGDAAGEAVFRKADAAAREKDEREAAGGGPASARGGEGKAEEEAETGRRRRRNKAPVGVPGEVNVGGEESKAGEGEAARRIKLKPLPVGRIELEREVRKAGLLMRRSEGLLYVCVHTLLNLAEDLELERKMCKRGVVGLLTPLLERDNAFLLLLTVNFLRKLSIFEENKDAMVAQGVGPRLVAILPPPSDVRTADVAGEVRTELLAAVLHLMFNLTFDATMCQAFVTAGCLGKVGAMLRASPYRGIGLKLLYRLSVEYPVRGQFAETDATPLTFKMAAQFPASPLPQELAALAVNLTAHPSTAAAFLGTKVDALKSLVARLVKTGDPTVAKMLRGFSWFTYTAQSDSELKAHAQEDARRLRESAQAKADTKRRKAAKRAKKARKARREAGEPDEGVVEPSDVALEDQPVPSASMSSNVGSYVPEPDVPLPYDYAYAGTWGPHLPDLSRALLASWEKGDDAAVAELLGLFANLTPADCGKGVTLSALSLDAGFMHVLTSCLRPSPPSGSLGQVTDPVTGATVNLAADCGPSDDVILEALQVVSALALDPTSALPLAAAGVPRLLSAALVSRPGDPDILQQGVTAIVRLLHHAPTRVALVRESEAPAAVAALLGHPHPGLAAEADDAVALMVEFDREEGAGGLWRSLQAARFSVHNREWLYVAGGAGGPGEGPEGYAEDGEEDEEYGDGNEGRGAAALVARLPVDGSSPLRKLGGHGEAVAYDVSYLTGEATGGGGRGRARSPSEQYDYVEDADRLPGEEEGEEEGEEGEDAPSEDVQALMRQYTGSGEGVRPVHAPSRDYTTKTR